MIDSRDLTQEDATPHGVDEHGKHATTSAGLQRWRGLSEQFGAFR